eukprot:4283604-Pyramimonas_sp.AAC.1
MRPRGRRTRPPWFMCKVAGACLKFCARFAFASRSHSGSSNMSGDRSTWVGQPEDLVPALAQVFCDGSLMYGPQWDDPADEEAIIKYTSKLLALQAACPRHNARWSSISKGIQLVIKEGKFGGVLPNRAREKRRLADEQAQLLR